MQQKHDVSFWDVRENEDGSLPNTSCVVAINR